MEATLVVSSAQVAEYRPLAESQARLFTRFPDLGSHYDDLEQEGLIAIWQALRHGHRPSVRVVQNALREYARKERRRGMTGYDPEKTQVELVPLEDVE